MKEKTYRPVPDVECLKYHGTPEKPDIKIFVSHRTDLDSETIDNPLYIPVRCGAVQDNHLGATMLGDDTGKHISNKKDLYGSLTVLYWIWKNIKSDYYGFTEQNEYLAFQYSDSDCFTQPFLTKTFYEKFGISDATTVREVVEQYKIVIPKSLRVNDTQFAYKYYQALMYTNDTTDLDRFQALVEKQASFLSPYLKEYIDSESFNFHLAFVLESDYFEEYCTTLFSLLSSIEQDIDCTYYSEEKRGQFPYFALLLLGAYISYWAENTKCSQMIKELPVAKVEHVERIPELRPAFAEHNIPIVLVCSNEYVPYLSVYLRSLLDHVNQERNYDIVILQKQITQENQRQLSGMCREYTNVSLRFYNPKSRLSNVSFYVAQDAYCEEAYYRLFAPWYMEYYEKAIVMDCDILVRRDLADLFDIDLEGNYAAGVIDAVFQGMLNGWAAPDTLEYAKNEMKLSDPHHYLNTGVMLFDFKEMRANFTEKQLIEFSVDKHFRCQEQDILNVILEGHVKFLSLAWNCYVRTGDFVTYGLKWAPSYVYKEFKQAIEDPYLVHFVAYPKPWLDPRVEYSQQFWITARRTPYYETILFMLMESRYGGPIFSLQQSAGIFDSRSGARKLADELLPKGSKRREIAKILLPKGSRRWRLCKRIYYIFKPQYRSTK